MIGNLTRWRSEANRILRLRETLEPLDGGALFQKAREVQWRAKSGENLRRLLPDAYALGIEAATRALGMTHFPVQVMGAIALFEGYITEMQTGEGKTLTATLPVILRGMAGRGVHVVTSNDYLARRDAEQMGQVYSLLGLKTGCIQQQMPDPERTQNYQCDVTYGTASEVGFDFLRDRLKKGAGAEEMLDRSIFHSSDGGAAPVQRGHYFALIDEADSILIDEARTPLIIGVEETNRDAMVSLYRWCVGAIKQLKKDKDYIYEERKRQAHLTDAGCRHIVLLAKPVLLDSLDTERIYQHVEKALTAHLGFVKDRDYVIDDEGEISIVDEGTGRKMEGRKWQEGLHQSVEAKERLDVTKVTSSAARITIQSLFRHYEHLAGMTGTAVQARGEFKRDYKVKVSVIPTNKPCIREGLAPRIFVSQAAKFGAIVDEVLELTRQQRAVLIGTPSVDASEALSRRLKAVDMHHVVLNARFHEMESDIVAQAGKPGRVTIATNMAGRGTDIILEDVVRKAGGLHVIATEMHSSKRIDRQLVGRSARQGDPGSFQFFLSLQDELLTAHPPEKRERYIQSARPNQNGELGSNWLRLFKRTQRMLEKLHTKQRKRLLKFEKEQRKKYRKLGLDPYLELVDS